jgi:hypothetical protein
VPSGWPGALAIVKRSSQSSTALGTGLSEDLLPRAG